MDKDGYYDSDDYWRELDTNEKKERLAGFGFTIFEETIPDYHWSLLNEDEKKKVLASAPPITGIIDWNKLSMDQLVAYLENKHNFSSTGESYAIFKLIKFYKEHK